MQTPCSPRSPPQNNGNAMNIYNAIMKAADHIERNPGEFRFSSIGLPKGIGCGAPGCALGWIGFFAGVAHKTFDTISLVATNGVSERPGVSPLLSIDQGTFYKRMNELASGWTFDSSECAKGLRLYAAKYHAADARDDGDAFKRFLTAALAPAETCAANRLAP